MSDVPSLKLDETHGDNSNLGNFGQFLAILVKVWGVLWGASSTSPAYPVPGPYRADLNEHHVPLSILIADIYISISTGTFDIENIKYEKKWQQLDLDTNFEP